MALSNHGSTVMTETAPAEMATILVTSRSFGDGTVDLVGQLQQAGHHIVRGTSDHDHSALEHTLQETDAWIAGTGPVTAAHLDASRRLRIVARYGVGFESVDVPAATARGIWVTNTPGANSDGVADHAIALMLAALRGVVDGDRRVRDGDWRVFRGRELGTLTVGIVGFGRIGRGVAQRLSGFGTRILATDPVVSAADLRRAGVEPASLEIMANQCDVVTLHAPGGQVVVEKNWLATLDRPCVIVNTARADLVDEVALAAALRDGHVRAYAADTLEGDTGNRSSPLLANDLADRVTITPHLGAQTVEAVDSMGTIASTNILAALAGGSPPNAVNSPEPAELAARNALSRKDQ